MQVRFFRLQNPFVTSVTSALGTLSTNNFRGPKFSIFLLMPHYPQTLQTLFCRPLNLATLEPVNRVTILAFFLPNSPNLVLKIIWNYNSPWLCTSKYQTDSFWHFFSEMLLFLRNFDMVTLPWNRRWEVFGSQILPQPPLFSHKLIAAPIFKIAQEVGRGRKKVEKGSRISRPPENGPFLQLIHVTVLKFLTSSKDRFL